MVRNTTRPVVRCSVHSVRPSVRLLLRSRASSTLDCRKRRIAEKYDISEYDAAAMIVDNDYSRQLYTKTFTGRDWTDATNYDISLDVRRFGVNGAVNFLMNCIG